MGFGDVEASADYTEGGLVVTPIENTRRAAALRKIAGTTPSSRTAMAATSRLSEFRPATGASSRKLCTEARARQVSRRPQ